jgi:hypothetical protein
VVPVRIASFTKREQVLAEGKLQDMVSHIRLVENTHPIHQLHHRLPLVKQAEVKMLKDMKDKK